MRDTVMSIRQGLLLTGFQVKVGINLRKRVNAMFCHNTEKWLYKLNEDYRWQSPFLQDSDWAFQDHTGKTRMKLMRDGTIVVIQGYAWDGCTPKFCLLDILIGTPDGAIDVESAHPKTWHASLVHDALCQFLSAGLPMSRAQVDGCFLKLMQERQFTLRYIYYAAVRLFAWLTKPLTIRIRNIHGGKKVELSGQ